MRCLGRLLLLACLLAGLLAWMTAAKAESLDIMQAEAAPAAWDDWTPPQRGWVPVRLIDDWSQRWPAHDGVVWYRLHWQQAQTQPVGLLINYVNLASAIYVNGSLVARDPQLIEPLSRHWIKPQYFVLSKPLLREGDNRLLVRVSGLAAYHPGFGKVTLGAPAEVYARYTQSLFERFQIKLMNFAMAAVLGGIFFVIWLLRRKDTVFGWFAFMQLTYTLYDYDFVATSPWPFTNTDSWNAFNLVFCVMAATGYAMFLFRFVERRFPWLECSLGALCVALLVLALVLPRWAGPTFFSWFLLAGAIYYASVLWFMWQAWCTPRLDYRVLAVCLALPILVSMRDMALFYGLVESDTYLTGLTSVLTLFGIAFVLAYRFVAAMRRVEGFNASLKQQVDEATQQLRTTLNREYQLELEHSRSRERLQLTRDLHDGFGSTLVSAIAQLEYGVEAASKQQMVALLKDMRDDLRLVIDTTAVEHSSLEELLAPLRYRLSRLLEAANIDSQWQVHGLDSCWLDSARNLDLLRLLQEALTNVFKHSGASQVNINLERDAGWIRLQVRDNGGSLGVEKLHPSQGGAGIASMRMRASRLGGELQLGTLAGETVLQLVFPLSIQA